MCDTLVSLTADGVLFAKNSDRDVNEAQVLRWHPPADHVAGSDLATTWTTIPQVTHTHAILLSQPWWMWGAEIGANEHGVVIGNEAVFTRRTGDGVGVGTLLGMDLLRLGLERAISADEAVEVILALLEEHGQGGRAATSTRGSATTTPTWSPTATGLWCWRQRAGTGQPSVCKVPDARSATA